MVAVSRDIQWYSTQEARAKRSEVARATRPWSRYPATLSGTPLNKQERSVLQFKARSAAQQVARATRPWSRYSATLSGTPLNKQERSDLQFKARSAAQQVARATRPWSRYSATLSGTPLKQARAKRSSIRRKISRQKTQRAQERKQDKHQSSPQPRSGCGTPFAPHQLSPPHANRRQHLFLTNISNFAIFQITSKWGRAGRERRPYSINGQNPRTKKTISRQIGAIIKEGNRSR